jgi:uncharacterized protein YukE
MDVEQIRGLARRLDREAGTIDAAISSLGSQVNSVEWRGRDRDGFTSGWAGHSRRLREVAEGLRVAARDARAHADRQQRTSAG